MIKRVCSVILVLLMLGGCAATTAVEPEYRPLEQLSERPWYLCFFDAEDTATAVGETVYVQDLEDWLTKRPRGSNRYDAVLSHEQVHSWRQEKTSGWLTNYLTDKDFRWEEEQLGWYIQIQILKRRHQIVPEALAKILSEYKPDMVDYQEALQWVRDVLSGRWKPDPQELPPRLRNT